MNTYFNEVKKNFVFGCILDKEITVGNTLCLGVYTMN